MHTLCRYAEVLAAEARARAVGGSDAVKFAVSPITAGGCTRCMQLSRIQLTHSLKGAWLWFQPLHLGSDFLVSKFVLFSHG
jgi:hypothetical protein